MLSDASPIQLQLAPEPLIGRTCCEMTAPRVEWWPKSMLRVIVNETELDCPEGTSLLEAARQAGVDVPTLCFDPRFDPLGTCRICCVEIAGEPKPKIAWTS